MYACDGEWQKTRLSIYFKRLIFGLILVKVGLLFGEWDAQD
jgi:hypothetical protein